jgi:hypothetical protein
MKHLFFILILVFSFLFVNAQAEDIRRLEEKLRETVLLTQGGFSYVGQYQVGNVIVLKFSDGSISLSFGEETFYILPGAEMLFILAKESGSEETLYEVTANDPNLPTFLKRAKILNDILNEF